MKTLCCVVMCCAAGWGFSMGSEFQVHTWRVFILVCIFPALAALIGIIFMPESPRFLLEVSALETLVLMKLLVCLKGIMKYLRMCLLEHVFVSVLYIFCFVCVCVYIYSVYIS